MLFSPFTKESASMASTFRSIPCLIVAVLALAAPARADVTLVFAENGVPRTIRIFRMTSPGTTTYRELGEADVEAMRVLAGKGDDAGKGVSEEMAKAMAELEENLKGLPPEQQAMIRERMHAGSAMAGGAPETTYEPLSVQKKVGGYPVTGYRVLEDGEPTGEIWAARLQDVGLTEKDLTAVSAMATFLEDLTKDLPLAQDALEPRRFNPKADGFLGFPVLVVEGVGSDDETRTELQKILKGPVDPKQVQVPSTYTKETLVVPTAPEDK
jgi:hypothetical protein